MSKKGVPAGFTHSAKYIMTFNPSISLIYEGEMIPVTHSIDEILDLGLRAVEKQSILIKIKYDFCDINFCLCILFFAHGQEDI